MSDYKIGSVQRYIFSGTLTSKMCDYLLAAPQFEPIDALVSQLDRSGVKTMLEHMKRGVIKSLFIDSGAYSVHSMGFEKVSKGRFATFNDMVDEYINYVNEMDDKTIAVAQFDHIPGVFKRAKSAQDYVESAQLTWENFLYMYPKMKSPEKLIFVYHQGESFDHLDAVLNWRDPNGNPLPYIGISPSNDRSVAEKDIYLKEVYEHIAKSSNPNVKTHLFGYTSLPGLPKFPWYTADSVSHRLRAGYNKIFTRKWGTISLSSTRESKTKSDKMFLEVADPKTAEEFTKLIEGYGLTVDQVIEESAARTAVDMLEVQAYMRENPYKPTNLMRSKRLFNIG